MLKKFANATRPTSYLAVEIRDLVPSVLLVVLLPSEYIQALPHYIYTPL